MNSQYTLKTIGHATLILEEDNIPIIATDPWLIGSTYWRSWWLEKYPTKDEVAKVKSSENIYITHSHPDHFHFPSLRYIGNRRIFHPRFPHYKVPDFLQENGFQSEIMEPWTWKSIGKNARMMSIPVPIDDSILVIETPVAIILNFNDSNPRSSYLRLIRDKLIQNNKTVIVLKSYSPAGIATSIYKEGKASPMKDKRDYTISARNIAESVNATHYIPFASQVFFSRNDSVWANETKVKFEDLQTYWGNTSVKLCPPFIKMDLNTCSFSSSYSSISRKLADYNIKKVIQREKAEADFTLPEDCGLKLQKYLNEIFLLKFLFYRGIGWKLTTSNKEFFYNTRTGKIENKIPENYDLIISLPDMVLYESLENNILTDVGISMFIRVDTKVSTKFTYGFFLLMGLHDYGHFNSPKEIMHFVRFYAPHGVPFIIRLRSMFSKKE